MKYLLLILAITPSILFASSKINCSTTERYNDKRIENSFLVEIDHDVAFKQIASQENSNILFVIYYSKANDIFGARVNDLNNGTQSGSFVEPSKEEAIVKVRYIKTIPETQLFAIDCSLDR